MIHILTLLLLLLVHAVTLYCVVRLMNPNPEVNPTLLAALGYSLVGMVLALFPGIYALLTWFGWWGFVFSKIFYLSDLALVIGLLSMRLGVEVTVRLVTHLAS